MREKGDPVATSRCVWCCMHEEEDEAGLELAMQLDMYVGAVGS